MRTVSWVLLFVGCGAQRMTARSGDGADRSPESDASVVTPHGPVSCSGHDLELETILHAPECTLAEDELGALEAATGPTPDLAASVLPDGRILVRATNTSGRAMTLAFGSHSAVDDFPVRARRKGRPPAESVSLVAATAQLPPAGEGFGQGWHFARVVLDPGGSVSVRLTIDRHVVQQSYAGCPPNAKCAPTKTVTGTLAPGPWVLHVGLPLRAPRLADDGAEVDWVTS